MAKDTYYFSHDYDPTGDPKIAAMIGEHGGLGYGIFWRLTEMLHSDDSHRLPFKKYLFLAIAKQMLSDATTIESFIKSCIDDYELFITDGNVFWSERVDRNIGKKDDLKQKRQEAGRIGGLNKAIAKQTVASAKQVLPIAKQNLAKEIKEKESKLNQTTLSIYNDVSIHKKIIDYLNLVAGTKYKATTKGTIDLINSRFGENYTVADFLNVIDKMVNKWIGDSKMVQYIRPETLFGNKFESYLNLIHAIKIDTSNAKAIKIKEDSINFKVQMGWI